MTDERLLRALTEELKLPLLQIARAAELHDPGLLPSIGSIADATLQFIDGFLLNAAHRQDALELTTVSVSSVLQDTAHKLGPIARQNDCDLEVHIKGKYGPIMAHKESLETAFMLIGYSMLEARPVDTQRHRVLLGVHKSPSGLVAGLFDNRPGLSADVLRRGRALYGSARQTMPATSGSNGAGIFIADSLLKAMMAPLHVARHRTLTGLAATLHPSKQLQIV